jgi:hypothetical protein
VEVSVYIEKALLDDFGRGFFLCYISTVHLGLLRITYDCKCIAAIVNSLSPAYEMKNPSLKPGALNRSFILGTEDISTLIEILLQLFSIFKNLLLESF